MPLLLSFLLRAVVLAAGLVMAAVLALVFAVLVSVWLLRAGWARLTGRPLTPFAMHMGAGARAAFEEMMRRTRPQPASRTPRADAAATGRRRLADVSDVEPK